MLEYNEQHIMEEQPRTQLDPALAERLTRSRLERRAASRAKLAEVIEDILSAMVVNADLVSADGEPKVQASDLRIEHSVPTAEFSDFLSINNADAIAPHTFDSLQSERSAADIAASLGEFGNVGGDNPQPAGQ